MKNITQKLVIGCLTLTPASATAEPGVSLGHIPLLWAIALALSAVAAWLIARLIAKLADVKSTRYRWGVAVILFLVFAIFLAPLFVVLGSILVTGRTM